MLTRTSIRLLSLLLICSFLLNGVAADEKSQHLNSPCNIHLSYLGAKYDPVKEYAYDAPPEVAHEAATHRVEPTVSTYIVAPASTAEFARIFGREPSSGEVDDMNAFQTKAKGALGAEALRHQLTSKSYEGMLRESKSSFEILVGHNDGGSFKFQDGSAMDLADMLGTAFKYNKQLILVSCRAVQNSGVKDALGTTREITYPEGLFIAERLASAIRGTQGDLSISGVRERLQAIEDKADFKFNVKYLILQICGAVAAGVVIALVIYILDDDRKKRKSHPDGTPENKPTSQRLQSFNQAFSS